MAKKYNFINTAISDDLNKRINEHLNTLPRSTTRSDIIRQALEEYLERQKQENHK